MPDKSVGQRQRNLGRPGRLIYALYRPDSYALVLLLIIVTYVISATVTADWATSVVLAVQITTIWVTFRASHVNRRAQVVVATLAMITALAAVANLVLAGGDAGHGIAAAVSGLLYFITPFVIVRHLARRRTVDVETVLGAIAAYLMTGIFFAFAYRAIGILQASPFFGLSGDGTFPQALFFSFTTLTTTGYGNLVPAGNPGQTVAVLEMLTGQLFLVTAVAKVVSSWRPGAGRTGLRSDAD